MVKFVFKIDTRPEILILSFHMFDLGTQELIVIFLVAFLVFGPRKLPELGRTLGKGIRELKAAMRGLRESIEETGEEFTDGVKDC